MICSKPLQCFFLLATLIFVDINAAPIDKLSTQAYAVRELHSREVIDRREENKANDTDNQDYAAVFKAIESKLDHFESKLSQAHKRLPDIDPTTTYEYSSSRPDSYSNTFGNDRKEQRNEDHVNNRTPDVDPTTTGDYWSTRPLEYNDNFMDDRKEQRDDRCHKAQHGEINGRIDSRADNYKDYQAVKGKYC